jgi:predicted aspartyl protease
MLRSTILLGILTIALGCRQHPMRGDLKALYEAQRWPELYDALEGTQGNDFYRGAVAVTFHQDPQRAESYLKSTIAAAPTSDEAYQAYEWLSHLFLYTGQYQRAVAIMEAKWTAFPEKTARVQEQAEFAAFQGAPDQITERAEPSTVPHEENSIFIPVSINGSPATFFFDTGAWVSTIGESEAKRLGLQFTDATGTLTTMTRPARFRTAVASRVVVGDVELANVTFFVGPDDQEPWSVLPSGRRGLLGIPVILAFRTLRWARSGTMRIGEPPAAFDVHTSNVVFDNDHLAVRVAFERRTAFAVVDTGAEGTDMFREFSVQFPSTMASGTKGSTQVRGVGGAESYESVRLPVLAFEVGGRWAILHGPHVLLSRGIRSYVANIGMDVFRQGDALTMDFSAMRLRLED